MFNKIKNKYILFATIFVMFFCFVNNISRAQEPDPMKATMGKMVAAEGRTESGDKLSPEEAKIATEKLNNSELEPSFDILNPVRWILYELFVFVGWLMSIGSTLLGWTLSPLLLGKGGFLEKEIVYDLWGQLRDIFNMLFILMLLFSAFATIFQVSKYNIKKIFLSMLLAVLLINFSYPIARVIIDISNVMMFSFLNGSSGVTIAAGLAYDANIVKVLIPGDYSTYPIPYLLFAIVFVFIFGVTLVVLGVMLLIRLIALMVIIIASPIGFVGSVFPGMGSFSSKWWDALFKYSFFGPIMAFILMASMGIMEKVGEDVSGGIILAARPNSPANMGEDFAKWLSGAAFMFLPVVLLWIGMGISKSMSIFGADAVVGAGQKFAKWTGNLPKRGVSSAWQGSGIPGGFKSAKDEFFKSGKILGRKVPLYGGKDARDLREAKFGGALTNKNPSEGWRNAQDKYDRKKISEKMDEYKKNNTNVSSIKGDLDSKDTATAMAAALHLAEKGLIKDANELNKVYTALGGTETGSGQRNEKNRDFIERVQGNIKKDNNVQLLAKYEIEYDAKGKPPQDIMKEHFGKLSAENFAKQKGLETSGDENEHMRAYVENMAKSNKQFYQEVFAKLSENNQGDWAGTVSESQHTSKNASANTSNKTKETSYGEPLDGFV